MVHRTSSDHHKPASRDRLKPATWSSAGTGSITLSQCPWANSWRDACASCAGRAGARAHGGAAGRAALSPRRCRRAGCPVIDCGDRTPESHRPRSGRHRMFQLLLLSGISITSLAMMSELLSSRSTLRISHSACASRTALAHLARGLMVIARGRARARRAAGADAVDIEDANEVEAEITARVLCGPQQPPQPVVYEGKRSGFAIGRASPSYNGRRVSAGAGAGRRSRAPACSRAA